MANSYGPRFRLSAPTSLTPLRPSLAAQVKLVVGPQSFALEAADEKERASFVIRARAVKAARLRKLHRQAADATIASPQVDPSTGYRLCFALGVLID